jgi:quinol monooxygenase YgiN
MNLLVVKLKIKPGTAAEFVATAQQLAASSRAEPGCLSYELWKGDDDVSYAMVEKYADSDAAQAHRKTDHYRALGRKLGDYLDGKPEAIVLNDQY